MAAACDALESRPKLRGENGRIELGGMGLQREISLVQLGAWRRCCFATDIQRRGLILALGFEPSLTVIADGSGGRAE